MKKPTITLREPVRLHQTRKADLPEQQNLSLPNDREANNKKQKKLVDEAASKSEVEVIDFVDKTGEGLQNAEAVPEELKFVIEQRAETQNQSAGAAIDSTSQLITAESSENAARKKMSARTAQIWDYLCGQARANGQRSFSLTRAQIMREAKIGSTNTYRDALATFQDLNLLDIELRPGVTSGSVFTFTKQGWREAGFSD